MITSDVGLNECDTYYHRYIAKVPKSLELYSGAVKCKEETKSFFRALSEEEMTLQYQLDKWTIKEVLQHLIDTERIFSYRLFRIARRDSSSLVSFDQDIYVRPSRANQKSKDQLLQEYDAVSNASISLINSLNEEDLKNIGVSSGSPMSARAAAYIILGHENWHIDIIKERYLKRM